MRKQITLKAGIWERFEEVGKRHDLAPLETLYRLVYLAHSSNLSGLREAKPAKKIPETHSIFDLFPDYDDE